MRNEKGTLSSPSFFASPFLNASYGREVAGLQTCMPQ